MDQNLLERDGQMSSTLEEEKMEITMTTQQENLIVTPGKATTTETQEEETGAGRESATVNSAWTINDSEDEDSEDTDRCLYTHTHFKRDIYKIHFCNR